jgi:hypothetical protein
MFAHATTTSVQLRPKRVRHETRTKIRFTGQQLAFVRQAHPHCRFDGLLELSFEFDRVGNLVNCTAKIDCNAPERDVMFYADVAARLYAIARKRFNARTQGSATVLQFRSDSNGSRPVA